MYIRSRPMPGMLVLLALVACETATEPTHPPLGPQFSHDPATEVTSLANDGPGSLRDRVFNAQSGATIHFADHLAGGIIVVNSPIALNQTLTIEGPAQGITISGGGATTVFSVSIGLVSNPVVTLRNLTITGGDTGLPSDGHGTAIYATEGTLRVLNSTLMGNAGNAIHHVGGPLLIQNSTISGNGEDGLDSSAGGLTLRHVTIAHNSGHGLRRAGSAVTLQNTLIANNATDCRAGPGADPNTLAGVNLDSDNTCGLSGADLRGVDPLIEPLGNYGGPTPTHELKVGSPAVDAANCTALETDQRGVERPQGFTCDIGAYERIPVSAGLTIDPTGTVNPKTGAATITGTLTCSRALDVELQVDLQQVQMVRRVPVPKQSSATVAVPCNGAQVSWSATLQPPPGTAFVNGAASAAAEAVNADDSGATQRDIRLFWAKK